METLLSPERAARLLARLRLEDAARLSGYSSGMLSMAERGLRRMRPKIKKRLLEIYRIERAKS